MASKTKQQHPIPKPPAGAPAKPASAATASPFPPTTPASAGEPSSAVAATATSPAAGSGAGGDSVWTPWGPLEPTGDEAVARDPFEPEAPLSPAQAAVAAKRRSPATAGAVPLTVRELYEMFRSPAGGPARQAANPWPAAATAGRMSIGPMVPRRADAERSLVGARATDGGRADARGPAGPAEAYPRQAELILSALEAGQANGPRAAGGVTRPPHDRRDARRRPYRVRAALRLYSDAPDAAPRPLFTRDVHARGLGFISEHRLPLGNAGTVELPDPAGGDEPVRVACTVLRCREAAPGWYEGSVCFTRPQPAFDTV